MNIFRSAIFHTPANPFHSTGALVSFNDGALAVHDGRIAACAEYEAVRALYPDAEVQDLRGGVILPGFVDAHIHFPQTRIIGGLGYSLLDWLERLALPEEAKLADIVYARTVAREFVDSLAANGTTTALVFGAHFPAATAALFEAARRKGLRIVGGLVLSDRLLRSDLLQTPDAAYAACRRLIEEVRSQPRLGYAVIPRFALSTSDEMLEVCAALLREDPSLLFTTHINENFKEIEEIQRRFPDYLDAYDRFGLISRRSILAHNVHTTGAQLGRLAETGAAVAHCPCSNAALGSGVFPMKRHLEHNVRFALGTDVGAGTGFGMPKESLQAYLMQRIAPEPMTLTAAQMLYLATKAGAEALNRDGEIGDFTPGKSADFVCLKQPGDKPGPPVLSELLTQADAAWTAEVWVEGTKVHAANQGARP